MVTLPTSYYKGDMYLTPAATSGSNHGHIGIYGDTNWVVEASGPDYLSDWYWHYQISVAQGSKFLETTFSQVVPNCAADYAYNYLREYPYNAFFWDNKKNPSVHGLNCSQLVWLAYRIPTGADLDGNAGPGVYPYDIEGSPYTRVNWIVQ